MSSNMYGFTCTVPWQGREYFVQVVYKGTHGDSEESLSKAIADWETTDPMMLAQFEVEHRDWTKKWHADARISVMGCYGGWLESDPRDPQWEPPTPSEREILEVIAAGLATDYDCGWDT